MHPITRIASAVAVVTGAALHFAALAAPTSFTTVPVGTQPSAIAVNPITNKVYVANWGDNTVSVIDGFTQAKKNVTVGVRPQDLAINPETSAVYVANVGDSTYSVIDGGTDAVRTANIPVSATGGMAINQFTNRMYQMRETTADEVNIIVGDTFLQGIATRGHSPIAMVMNPVTNRLYMSFESGGDVVAFNMDNDPEWPLRECPDGNGGLIPDTDPHNPTPPPCIAVPNTAVALAIDPVTSRIYSLSQRGEIAEIQAPNHTFASFVPPNGRPAGAHSIAVNPLTHKVYATYADRIVVMDGATHAMQEVVTSTVAGGVNLGIAIDALANRIYVLNSAGVLLTLNGDDNALAALPGILSPLDLAVNPLTHTVYVLGDKLYALADGTTTAHASPLAVAITPLAGNQTTGTGSLTVTASSTMTPALLGQVRAVYYEIVAGAGTFTGHLSARANGTGPYTIPFTNLAAGTYTVNVVATNGLDAPSTNADHVSVPLTSPVARYTFTVGSAPPPLPAPGKVVKANRRVDLNGDFRADLAWRRNDNVHGLWIMNGLSIQAATGIFQAADARIVQLTDLNGDGKADLLWKNSVGDIVVSLMDGLNVTSTALLRSGSEGWIFATAADFDGDGKADLLWFNATSGYSVWLMNGASVRTVAPLPIPAAAARGTPVMVADLDGDGRDDILWSGPDGAMVLCVMAGTSCSSTPIVRAAGSGFTPVATGDFNGDGKADIVWTHADGRVALWLMNGGTMLDKADLLPAATGWRVIGVGDLDGDTRSDLLWEQTDGSTGAWLMAGLTAKAFGGLVGPGSGWKVVGNADLDGNGTADLIWRRDDGAYGAWLMNGTQLMGYTGFFDGGTGWELAP